MPIPSLNVDGLLPGGIFDCTLDEVRRRFGVFQESDRRPRLFARLEELLVAMRQSGIFEAILLDGSFVTGKPAPNDIDLIAVLPREHDFEAELSVSRYALAFRFRCHPCEAGFRTVF